MIVVILFIDVEVKDWGLFKLIKNGAKAVPTVNFKQICMNDGKLLVIMN